MSSQAQICVFVDGSGVLHAEAPSHVGSAGRVKIELGSATLKSMSPHKLGKLILKNLKDQQTWLDQEARRAEIIKREQEYKDSKRQKQIEAIFDAYNERHREVYDTCASRKGQGVEFAERVIGKRSAKIKAPVKPTVIEF
jgi:hypothetical protein